MAVALQTTDVELHTLADLEDKAREGTEFVRVPRAALKHLLRDHYTLNSLATAPVHRGGKGQTVTTVKD